MEFSLRKVMIQVNMTQLGFFSNSLKKILSYAVLLLPFLGLKAQFNTASFSNDFITINLVCSNDSIFFSISNISYDNTVVVDNGEPMVEIREENGEKLLFINYQTYVDPTHDIDVAVIEKNERKTWSQPKPLDEFRTILVASNYLIAENIDCKHFNETEIDEIIRQVKLEAYKGVLPATVFYDSSVGIMIGIESE